MVDVDLPLEWPDPLGELIGPTGRLAVFTHLARASLFLANRGRSPYTDEQILPAEWTKYVNALMLTCGTYDAAGDFAFRVGLPTKSGVGGGLLAVMPQGFAACAWSPGLDRVGNSIAGAKALELLAQATGLSIF